MKRSIVAAAGLSILGLSSWMFGARIPSANPFQCVTCEVRSGCWRCVGGGQADNCPSVNCESCTVQGLCDPEIHSLTHKTQRIKLKAELIREIAATHPRFAATLAKLNNDKFVGASYRVSWTPVPLDPGDIEFYLSADPEKNASYQKLLKRARRINQLIEKGQVAPIVYDVSIENLNSDAPLLRVRVVKGSEIDPMYTELEVGLRDNDSAQALVSSARWTIR